MSDTFKKYNHELNMASGGLASIPHMAEGGFYDSAGTFTPYLPANTFSNDLSGVSGNYGSWDANYYDPYQSVSPYTSNSYATYDVAPTYDSPGASTPASAGNLDSFYYSPYSTADSNFGSVDPQYSNWESYSPYTSDDIYYTGPTGAASYNYDTYSPSYDYDGQSYSSYDDAMMQYQKDLAAYNDALAQYEEAQSYLPEPGQTVTVPDTTSYIGDATTPTPMEQAQGLLQRPTATDSDLSSREQSALDNVAAANEVSDLYGNLAPSNFGTASRRGGNYYELEPIADPLGSIRTFTSQYGYAEGGLAAADHPAGEVDFMSEGSYNNYVRGDGDGTSDDIPAMLANGEYVIPADVVASLGNGDNQSGADILDQTLVEIRKHKTSNGDKGLPPDSKGALEYLNNAKRKV